MSFDRRNLMKRGVGLGIALPIAGFATASGVRAQDATPTSDNDATQEKADAEAAHTEAKSVLERAASDVTDDTRAIYDGLKRDLDALDQRFEDAGRLAGHDAARAYREIQHEFHRFDHEVDTALHKVGHAPGHAWHDVRSAFRDVHNRLDHVVDRIIHRD